MKCHILPQGSESSLVLLDIFINNLKVRVKSILMKLAIESVVSIREKEYKCGQKVEKYLKKKTSKNI